MQISCYLLVKITLKCLFYLDLLVGFNHVAHAYVVVILYVQAAFEAFCHFLHVIFEALEGTELTSSLISGESMPSMAAFSSSMAW